MISPVFIFYGKFVEKINLNGLFTSISYQILAYKNIDKCDFILETEPLSKIRGGQRPCQSGVFLYLFVLTTDDF